MPSKIEWTDETWNPIIGCSRVSAGCQHCYAERVARRLAKIKHTRQYAGVLNKRGEWNGSTTLVESQLDKPLHWRTPRRVFVGSMGDLFHESVDRQWIHAVWRIMIAAHWHRYMILTKRPRRMQLEVARALLPLPNVALGVSAENQETANERIPTLLECPAAYRFVSVEPMLSYVDPGKGLMCREPSCHKSQTCGPDCRSWEGVDLVICGGESGPGARFIHPDWARQLRNDCQAAGVPFMFKQWGDYYRNLPPKMARWTAPEAAHILAGYNLGVSKGGRLLDGREHNGAIDWSNPTA